MSKCLSIIFLFVSFASLAQKDINLGQGIWVVDFENLPTLDFFSDTAKMTSIQSVSVVKDKQGEYIIKDATKVASWFQPEGLWLDYSIFIIRVESISDKWYKVYTNNEKGDTLWAKAESVKKFIKWETFLLDATTSIDKIRDFDLDVKEEPTESSKTIKKMESTDCFEALEIKGDWLRIKTNETLDCNESKKVIKSGWIKWRRDNKLTIGYGLTC